MWADPEIQWGVFGAVVEGGQNMKSTRFIGGSRGGGRQGRAPEGQILLFSCIFRQNICKIVPIWELAPPRENPGSATAVVVDRFISNFTTVLPPPPPAPHESINNTRTQTLDIEAREFSTNILTKRMQSFKIMSFLYISMYFLAFLVIVH